jgi:hypothetical protein
VAARHRAGGREWPPARRSPCAPGRRRPPAPVSHAPEGVASLTARAILPVLIGGLSCTQMLDGDRFDQPIAIDAAFAAADAALAEVDVDAGPASPPADACTADAGPADGGSEDGDGDPCMHSCAAQAQDCRAGCADDPACAAGCQQDKKECQRACRAAQAARADWPIGSREVTPSPE